MLSGRRRQGMNELSEVKIAFIILHYNATKETINCVDSIKKNADTAEFHIVIVDNGSPNASGDKLAEKYNGDPIVTVLICQDNLGFARGNNEGISYARENLVPDFICCMNNDTLLEQKDFCRKLADVYIRTGAAVIGPEIILKNGTVQLFTHYLCTVRDYQIQLQEQYNVLKGKRNYKKLIKKELMKVSLFYRIDMFRHHLKKDNYYHENYSRTELTDVVLHGCCLIFTPAFFNRLEGFCPDTFLFREEEILCLELQKNGLHSVYAPKLQIRHLEDAATNSRFKRNREKELFMARNQIQSLKILLGMMLKQ